MATAKRSDELQCSLNACAEKDDLRAKSRVEVKSFVPLKRTNLVIKWGEDGQAVFHRKCWNAVRKKDYEMEEEERRMVKEAAKTAEYFDSLEDIEKEAQKIAKYLKISCHAIAFTGAGISTSAVIGDFRGKGGKWTERDRKKAHGKAAKPSTKGKAFVYESLRPTYTHEAIAKLVEMGIIKYVISQNVDGIHRLSGVPREQISELHGNVFHEKCEKCDKRFERNICVRGLHKLKTPSTSKVPQKKCSKCRINHRTGRVCDKKGCGGYLMNTIINFGDSLEDEVIDIADQNARANDMVLCLGSSLTVTPACDFVEMGNPVRIAICNRKQIAVRYRQPTPFDDESVEDGARVFGDCDDLMRQVMKYILEEDELKTWEEGRQERMRHYASQRGNSALL